MKIKCDKCEFEDIPENWNALIYKIDDDNFNFYLLCPVCDTEYFVQHAGQIQGIPENSFIIAFSHLFACTLEEAKTSKEAKELTNIRWQEFRLKHNKPLEITVK
ncbi:MAG: hypothetical protein WC325_11605 [Candidatus Bathyarchaeia archaeon]|jgi:hypothetical protein